LPNPNLVIRKEMHMSDLLYIGLAVGFFAASVGIIYAFASLQGRP
jgi:hypothetical protein